LDKVLVTGGCGFVGSFLVERLCSLGKEVVVFDNKWKAGERNLAGVADKINFIEGDIRDYQQVSSAMRGCDTVFHLASIQGTKYFYEKPDLVLEVGLTGNLNVAKACADNNVSRVLFTSSSENYGQAAVFPTPETQPLVIQDPKNPRWSYSATKIAGEVIFANYARKFGYGYTVIRIHNAYGPRMGWQHVVPEFVKRLVLGEKFTIQGSGKETRAFCYIDDLIDGMILSATSEGGRNEIFNLGNDKEEHQINEVARMLHTIAGKEFNPEYVNLMEGSTTRRIPDITKARSIGYDPKVGLVDGLTKAFNWYRDEINWWLANAKPDEYPWLR
jgi:nucleoside-diphosphate-sugar epimerase